MNQVMGEVVMFKKRFFKWIVTSAVTGLSLIYCLQVYADQTFSPRIIRVKGDVKILEKEGQDWKIAEENMFLGIGTQINTGLEGVCDISFDDGLQNLMSVRALSRATLTSLEPPYITVANGKYFALLDSLQGNTFSIDSGVAVAAVRGSAMLVEYQEARKEMKVSAFHHETQISSQRFGNVSLDHGKMVSISSSIGYSKPLPISGDQRIEWNHWMQAIRQMRSGSLGSNGVTGKIKDANKAYYISNPCAELIPCKYSASATKDQKSKLNKAKENQKNDFIERENLLLYLDDNVLQNSVVEMPYDESYVSLELKDMEVELKGTMLFAITLDSGASKFKLKLFQAGKFIYETSYQNGQTKMVIQSRNPYGLRTTRVNVDEGSVALTMPWLCGGQDETQTFQIESGECYEQYIGGLEDEIIVDDVDDDIDDMPKVPDAPDNTLEVSRF